MSIELLIHFNHLSLCRPLLFLPSVFPSIRVFSKVPVLRSGGQSMGVSASASVLSMNIQDWFPLGLSGLISLKSKGHSRVFSSTTVWKHQFFGAQLLYGPALTSTHNYWKNHGFDYMNFVGKVMSLLFNTLSRFVIAFLPRSNHLLISCLQSTSMWF